jgi:hypothetical protein
MASQPKVAKFFVGLMAVGGLVSLSHGLLHMHPWHPAQFGTLLVLAMLAARLKLKLPGFDGNMSVNLPFILIAMVELNLFEALMIAAASTLAQCFPKHGGRPKAVQTLFNVSTAAVAVGLAGLIFQGKTPVPTAWLSGSLLLSLVTASFFLAQTIPVATIISLTKGGSAPKIWSSIFDLSFSYYVLSAGVASLVTTASHRIGWPIPLLVLPVMYGVYRSYRLYFGRDEASALPNALAKAAGAAR